MPSLRENYVYRGLMWDEPSANDTNCPTHENSKWQTIREKVWWATEARLYPVSPVITTNFPKESKTFSSSLTICYYSVFLDKNTETQRHGVLFSFKQSKAYKSSIRRLMNKTQWFCVSVSFKNYDYYLITKFNFCKSSSRELLP